VSCVAWSASGKRLASGDEEGVVKIWHIDEPVVRLLLLLLLLVCGQCVCLCVLCSQLDSWHQQ
jgi:WD40 repeat protein